MPSIITHAVVPMAMASVAGRPAFGSFALTGALLAMAPDLDVVGFKLGIAYADAWGHRGATHALMMACIATLLVMAVWPRARRGRAAAFLFLAAASHGLLDMATDGGLGVALLWPADAHRYFWPWRPIRVSPIGAGFFSLRGLATIRSELMVVWLPCMIAALLAALRRKRMIA